MRCYSRGRRERREGGGWTLMACCGSERSGKGRRKGVGREGGVRIYSLTGYYVALILFIMISL
jgi:hypothetical protein